MEFHHPKRRAPAELPGKETVQKFFFPRFLGSLFKFSKSCRGFNFLPNFQIQGWILFQTFWFKEGSNLKNTFCQVLSIGRWTTHDSLHPLPNGSPGWLRAMQLCRVPWCFPTNDGHSPWGFTCFWVSQKHEERRDFFRGGRVQQNTPRPAHNLCAAWALSIFLAGRMWQKWECTSEYW